MDAKTILRRGAELWNARDREGFLALYDETVTFVDQATGERLVGREAFGKGFYDLWMDAYPDNELKDPVVFAEGALTCFEARFVGTNTGPLHRPEMDVPPTGKPVDAPFVIVAEVGGETVKSARHYYDRLLAFEQEGLVTMETLFAQLQPA
jgi:hypothetical protein